MELELRAAFHRLQPGGARLLVLGRVIRGGYLKVVTKHLGARGDRQCWSADISDVSLSGRDQLRGAREQFRPGLIGLVNEYAEDQRDQEGGGEAVNQRLALNWFCGSPPVLAQLFRSRADFSYSNDFFLEK